MHKTPVGANCGSPEFKTNNGFPTDPPTGFVSRKNMRLKDYDYARDAAYFITICCDRKRHLFGFVSDEKMQVNQFGRIVQEEWQRTQELRENIVLDVYVVMPNHFHAIMIIKNDKARENLDAEDKMQEYSSSDEPQFAPTATVGDVMKGFKQAVTLRMRSIGFVGKVWQRGYYDHVIRNIYDYENTVAYIINNPKNWSRDRNNPN